MHKTINMKIVINNATMVNVVFATHKYFKLKKQIV